MSVSHTAFFGDGEYQFALTCKMIEELEIKRGATIGALTSRIFTRQFAHADLHEFIRCALIGAGTTPKRAAELVATYAVDRPLTETYPLAVAIAETVWFGNPNEVSNGPA